MVKNFGGNKSKKQGRKFVGDPKASKEVRVPENEFEIIASVNKDYGNGRCQATCIDGKERICIIRNKFRGRGKKDNLVSIGTWVLIGKRNWETSRDGKLENCDLLVVYREDEKKKLMQICDFNFTAICKNNETTNTIIEDDCSIQFVDSKTQEYLNAAEQNIREKKQENQNNKTFNEEVVYDDNCYIIEFDDI
jgi:translation initiation factor 1A